MNAPAKAVTIFVMAALTLSAATRAADLEGCLKERADTDLTPAFVFEQLPTIDLTASLRRSLASAEQQMASRQASRARAQQEAWMASETESSSSTTTYTVSSQEQKSLSEAIAAQPKAKALPADVVGQAAKIGVNAAAYEADRLLKVGSTPAEAKRAGEAKGIAAASAALKLAGANPSPADLARVKGEIGGQVQAGADSSSVAAWARSTTTSVQRSRSQEQSQRTDVSRSRSTTDSTTVTDSAQQQWSESDTLANDESLTAGVPISFSEHLFLVWYPYRIPVGQQTKIEWRGSFYSCLQRANVMALGAYDALQYVAPRDPAVTAEVQRVYELGRAGYLIRYLNSVAGLAADPRMMSKAAALIMLHSLGRITTPNKAQSDASVTTLPEFKLQTIQRQVELIETIYQRQRALTGTEQPVSNLPAQMPLLQRPSGYPAPLSPQERIAYAYFDMLQQEGQLMQRRMGW